jgi:hypothetical protein
MEELVRRGSDLASTTARGTGATSAERGGGSPTGPFTTTGICVCVVVVVVVVVGVRVRGRGRRAARGPSGGLVLSA